MIKLLRKNGAITMIYDAKGYTPLHYCALRRHEEEAEELCKDYPALDEGVDLQVHRLIGCLRC
jgi:hypothetical protein